MSFVSYDYPVNESVAAAMAFTSYFSSRSSSFYGLWFDRAAIIFHCIFSYLSYIPSYFTFQIVWISRFLYKSSKSHESEGTSIFTVEMDDLTPENATNLFPNPKAPPHGVTSQLGICFESTSKPRLQAFYSSESCYGYIQWIRRFPTSLTTE